MSTQRGVSSCSSAHTRRATLPLPRCAPWLRPLAARFGCTLWLHALAARLGCTPQRFLLRAYQALYEQHKEATRSWLHMHYRLLLLLSSLATVLGIVALAIFPNGDVSRVGSDGEDIFDSAKVGPLPLLLHGCTVQL